nr:DNA repair protein RecO [Acetobacter sp. DsW_063]
MTKEGGASLEWEAPALVLSTAPFGEADLLVHLFSAEHGVVHGLARGGGARRNAAMWQPGNLVHAQWRARSAEQLGSLVGETVAAIAGRAIQSRIALSCLSSICVVADLALPERQPHPHLFDDTVAVLSALPREENAFANLLRWEMALLADLGFALDLSVCAVTGEREGLAYVSPRTGRAVSRDAAGIWAQRLLPLPALFMDPADFGTPEQWSEGLRLTGHFLWRDVFGPLHRPLPSARQRIADLARALGEQSA